MICAWIRQERTRLCWEMRHLRNWPAEAFARLCSCYLDMKPSQAADLLILLGPDGACEAVLQKVARIYGVGRSAREKAVRRRPVRSDSLRLLALLEKLPLGEIQTLGDRELGRSPELRGILECFAGEELHTWEPEDFLLLSGTFSGGPRQEDVKLDTGDRKRISAQISRLSWRAGERLEKQRERQYTKVR